MHALTADILDTPLGTTFGCDDWHPADAKLPQDGTPVAVDQPVGPRVGRGKPRASDPSPHRTRCSYRDLGAHSIRYGNGTGAIGPHALITGTALRQRIIGGAG